MAIKVPVRTVYDNANNAIGLSEMQSGEAVGHLHGGTGLAALGSAGQVLSVNSGGTSIEFGNVTTLVGIASYIRVANANVNFVTKSTAVSSNNALINLINNRVQVANVNASFVTKSTAVSSNTALINLINNRVQVANVNASFVTKSVALSSNNALLNLINGRMQIANVQSLVTTSINNVIDAAPGALDTLNELAAAIGDDGSFITTFNASVNSRLQVANANVTFVTKATALSSNTALINLVNNRLQVANANVTFVTKATALSSNNALTNLVNNRLQVANANVTFVTKATAVSSNNALLNLINNRVQVANANVTFATKSTALTSNNNLLSLINDRIQVANVASAIRPSITTVTANTTLNNTHHNDALIVNSSNTVIVTVAASSTLTTGDTFKIYPVSTGTLIINLNSGDSFLGTDLSSMTIETFSSSLVSSLQSSQIQGQSSRGSVTTGLYTKVEILYIGSGVFVLTK